MPITKVPVVHKFGIISSSHRLELQERLHRKALFGNNTGKKPSSLHRQPLDVTDEFVQLFNTTENLHKKEELEAKAKKLLERAKRRSGVKNCGQGDYVNLPLAWTEMIQLAQCKGRLQEECLDLLLTSLGVSPLERHQIPALFYLAETMLYCLRVEELHYPFLRTSEIKLLKVGQLVFERLFYHHMIGQLQEHGESKKRLGTYMDGLEGLQDVYGLYPNAFLYLRFVTEVGKIILAESQMENANTNTDKLPGLSEQTSQGAKDVYEYYTHVETRSSHSRAISSHSRAISSHSRAISSHSRAISSSVHDLSPTLWHALDVFQCTNSLSGGLRDALAALESCGFDLASETWVDEVIALQILGESAKTNMAAQKVLHHLAQRVVTIENLSTTLTLGSSRSRHSGDDKCIGSHDKVEMASFAQENKLNPEMPSGDKHVGVGCDEEKEHAADADDTIGLSGNVGPDVGGQPLHMPAFFSWYWEVAQTYTEVLENIVLFGNTRDIQKYALIGGGQDTEDSRHLEQVNMRSTGLVDLAFFKPKMELFGGEMSQSDWSWRIRFTAMQSLARICHDLKGDQTREGLRSHAWNTLLKANAKEKDLRVTEALKVSQMCIDSSSFLEPSLQEHPVSLGHRIAIGLSTAYLPPFPPPCTQTPRVRVPHRPHPAAHVLSEVHPAVHVSPEVHPTVHVLSEVHPADARPLQMSMNREVGTATASLEAIPDYITRKNLDLRRIIDAQWEKELSARLEAEEKEQMKALKEKQQYEDEQQTQLPASRQEKSKKSPKQPPAREAGDGL